LKSGKTGMQYDCYIANAFIAAMKLAVCCYLGPVAILRGGLGGPWPPRFLIGPLFDPPSFFLNFPFKFFWLTYTVEKTFGQQYFKR